MRKGTSLAAAVLTATLSTSLIVPAQAQPSTPAPTSPAVAPTETPDAQDSSATCIGVGVAAGLPLLALIPAGINLAINVPGFEFLDKINSDIQRQLGIFNPQLAGMAKGTQQAIAVAGGVTALGLAVAALTYLAKNCIDTNSEQSSISWTTKTDVFTAELPVKLTVGQPIETISLKDKKFLGFTIVDVTGVLPEGLTFDKEAKTLSGTPTKAGEYKVKVAAKNALGITVTGVVTLTVAAAGTTSTTSTEPTTTAPTSTTSATSEQKSSTSTSATSEQKSSTSTSATSEQKSSTSTSAEPATSTSASATSEPAEVVIVLTDSEFKGDEDVAIEAAKAGADAKVEGLPEGLKYDKATGKITGKVEKLAEGSEPKKFEVTITVGGESKKVTLTQTA